MRRVAGILFVGLLLIAAIPSSFGLIMTKSLTKAQAEQELGVIMKRELLERANEAGISMEFAPKGKLENFLSVQLDVYSVFPIQASNGVVFQKRLTSATLKPLIDTKEKVRVFFTVDPDYVDRTAISLRVKRANPTEPDGYDIRLDPKDFPLPPQPVQFQVAPTHQPTHTANPIKIAQGKFTGGIGAIMMEDPTSRLFVIRQTVTNSPAAKAGLQSNDIVLKINGNPTAGRKLKDIVDDLRGFIGTTVTLTIQRGGTNFDCVVHRTSWNNLQVDPPPIFNSDKLVPTKPKF